MNSSIIENKEKAVAFIVARLTSSRLPKKQLRTIGDRTILEWIINNLRQCEQVDDIVIATVAEPDNQPLIDFCVENELKYFWYEGEVNHVTTRLRKAAEVHNADICLLVSADCPLLHPPAIDTLVTEMRNDSILDCIGVKPNPEGIGCAMQGLLVHRKKAWQKADDLSDTPELKEHQFPVIGQNPELFNSAAIDVQQDIFDIPRRH